jgi:hypothetical protein
MVWKCVRAIGNGMIYIQLFPHGKKYIGQTIQGIKRFDMYGRHEGNNPHHTSALKKYGYDNVRVLTFDVPEFLLDSVETALIALYDTIDREKGYNKKTGGANGRHNQDSIEKMRTIHSDGRHKGVKKTPEQVAKTSGENNGMFGKRGKESPNWGKRYPKTEEQIANQTGEKNGMFGKTFKKTPEQIAKSSGINHGLFGKFGGLHPRARPVCIFGIVYSAAIEASDALRSTFAKRKKNFISDWMSVKKHQSYTFYVSRDFYRYAIENQIENVTRDFYDIWTFVNL